MGKCIIVAAGERCNLDFEKNGTDLLIAADAGLKYLMEDGFEADMVVGDFDTLKYVPEHPNVVRLQPEKDVTDTWEAVSQAIKLGYREFHIYCGLGGRFEHSVANVQLLSHLTENGMKGFLYDRLNIMTCIRNQEITFDETNKGFISVFSLSDKSEGVTISGLKYEIHDHTLKSSFPLGVSNEFIGKPSKVKVENGLLLIVWAKQ